MTASRRSSAIAEPTEGLRPFWSARGLLQSWYDSEIQREREALLKWALENDVELESPGPHKSFI
jgi:hypothetical protein